MALFADNAQCNRYYGHAPSDIAITSGPCRDVWSYWENGVKLNKIKWIPVTNTHARNPEKGVLAVKFWHYALAENGCEGLIGGTGTLTFNKNGRITRINSYISEDNDFIDCM
eukprot:395668_1